MVSFTPVPLDLNTEISPAIKREEGNLEQAIDHILDLIIFTPKGTFGADPDFGFEYWNHEFSNINIREFNNSYLGMMGTGSNPVNEINRKQCEASIKESILAYEPRLLNPEVRIELDINEKVRNMRSLSKYEMRILITGSIDDGLGVVRGYEKRIAFMVEPTVKKFTI